MTWTKIWQIVCFKGIIALYGYSRFAVLFLTGFLLFWFGSVKAQTLEEWTKQKQLQTANKVNQIVALDAFLDGAKKGYDLVRSGWGLVGDIQDGELSLHRDYFSSMSQVHPLVKDYPRIGELQRLLGYLNREVVWADGYLVENSMLNAAEKRIYSRLNRNIMERSIRLKKQLDGILDGLSHDMGDGERMLALEELAAEASRLYRSMGMFHRKVRSIGAYRQGHEDFLEQVKNLNYDR